MGTLLSVVCLDTMIDIIIKVSIMGSYEMLENLVIVTLVTLFSVMIYVQY